MEKRTLPKNWLLLQEKLAQKENLAVAFSGGMDSSLLLAAAKQALPSKMKAYTCITPLIAENEQTIAASIVQKLKVPWQPLVLDNLSLSQIAHNAPDRCYHCKKFSYEHILAQAAADGFTTLAEGVHAMDLDEYRPGLRAAAELGVFQPFVELGWGKPQIKELLTAMHLEDFLRPPSPCLASRFPYGEELNPAKIAIVAAGEEVLHAAGFLDCRLRQYSKLARIEVPIAEIPRLLTQREFLLNGLRKLGFQHICLDLAGRQSGSMDFDLSIRKE